MTPLEQDIKEFYEGNDEKARVILNRLEQRTDDHYSQETVEVSASVTCLVLHNNPEIDKSKGIDLVASFERLKQTLKVV